MSTIYLHLVLVSDTFDYSAMACRARRQKDARKRFEKLIVKYMYRRLNTQPNKDRMVTTNMLLPLGSLRRKAVRNIFEGWIRKTIGHGRVLTRKLSKNVVHTLRSKFELGVLDDDEEVQRMHSLLKVAKKRKLSRAAMSNVDNLVTLPMEIPELEDWNLHGWGMSVDFW